MTNFTVYSSTPSRNGGFINVIQELNSSPEITGYIDTEIGRLPIKDGRTVLSSYMIKTPAQLAAGLEFQLDLVLFSQKEQEYTKDGEDRTTIWLYPKG